MDLKNAFQAIENAASPAARHLLLAALISSELKRDGYEAIVVGGSAIEFYTEGEYLSGDLDLCFRGIRLPSLKTIAGVMGRLGAQSLGTRNAYKLCGLMVDFLGTVDYLSQTGVRKMMTPLGEVQLMPPEDLLVERTFLSFFPQANSEARACAAILLSVCIGDAGLVDWKEVYRLAAGGDYDCLKQLEELKRDVEKKLRN